MKTILSLLILLTFTETAFCKPYDLINKKTNQWLHFAMSSSFGKNKFNKFYFITKSEGVDIKEIMVSFDNTYHFLDSLKRNGWTNKIRYKTVQEKYKPSLELFSISYMNTNDNDSVFQFIYKIIHTDKKHLSTLEQLDTLYGTEKKQVLKAIAIKDYKFDKIEVQQGTGIVLIDLNSKALFMTYKESDYNLVFIPWRRYFF